MNRWRCRRYRSALVDYVDDGLPPVEVDRLQRHLARCEGCTGELAALRAVPAMLRDVPVADPGEEFWRQQRWAIGRAVRRLPEPQRRGGRWRAMWLRPAPVGVAVLTVLVALVAVTRIARRSSARDRGTVSLGTLDDETLHDVDEVADVIAPSEDLVGQLAEREAFVPRSALEELVGTFLRPPQPFADDNPDDGGSESMG